ADIRGGSEMLLSDVLEDASQTGVHWIVAFLEDGPMVSRARALGIDTHVIRAGRVRHVFRFARTVTRLAALARRERVTALLSWMPKAHLYGAWAARLSGVPALWCQHGL